MEIDKKLYNEIKDYCVLNNLKPRDYIHGLLKKAFMEDKYGKMPPIFTPKQVKKNDEAFADFVDKVGPDKYREIVDESLFGDDDGTKNANTEAPEAVPDTDCDNMSRKWHENEVSRQNVSINVSIPENVEKNGDNCDKNTDKPKKRTIKPIR